MSSEEEAQIIGQMVLERKALAQRGTALAEKIRRVGGHLTGLAVSLSEVSPPYSISDFQLQPEHLALLDPKPLQELLTEAREVSKRFQELQSKLSSLGV